MPVHFNSTPKKLEPIKELSPKKSTDEKSAEANGSEDEQENAASSRPATLASTRYMNHYLGVLANLRERIKERIPEDGEVPKEDIFQVCKLLLKTDDEDFLIGLALQNFCDNLDAGRYEDIAAQLVEDLQGDEQWIGHRDETKSDEATN